MMESTGSATLSPEVLSVTSAAHVSTSLPIDVVQSILQSVMPLNQMM